MSCAKTTLFLTGSGVAVACILFTLVHKSNSNSAASPPGLQSPFVKVTDGVEYRFFSEDESLSKNYKCDVLVLDIDLNTPGVAVKVAGKDMKRRRDGRIFGASYTVRDWCRAENAVAGVNGGFFGATDGNNKQAEGLLVVDNTVLNGGSWIKSRRNPENSFVRSSLGIGENGLPTIGWATVNSDRRMAVYKEAETHSVNKRLAVSSAVGCGPRLVAGGKTEVSDARERLVSSLPRERTFVAYDIDKSSGGSVSRPRHFVLCVAMAMTYPNAAEFVQSYFKRTHNSTCAEAMCLDGGSSSQLVYADPRSVTNRVHRDLDWIETRPSMVTVPTAVLVTVGKR